MMEVKVSVDVREPELYSFLQKCDFAKIGCTLESKQLDIGDILFTTQDIDIPLLLIERKTVQDLCASIKDGRYREQKIRILTYKTVLRSMYLIEGIKNYELTSEKIENISTSAVLMSMTNSIVRDQLGIFHVGSTEDSATIIYSLAKSLGMFGKDLIAQTIGGEVRELKYTDTIRTVKKANITNRIAFIEMLCVVPGISKKRAEPLAIKYGNMNNLLEAIKAKKINEIKKVGGLGDVLYKRLISFLTTT